MTSSYGLTGDIASGKSTVSRYLEQLGFTIVDADLIAREVMLPGEKGHRAVKKAFPNAFSGDVLEREKLSNIIYEDPQQRLRLNQLLHPLIIERMLQEAEGKLVFFDAPLLFEAGLHHYCKKILYVGIDPKVQLERLMKRDGSSKEEAEAKMKAFDYPRKKKIEQSVYLDNNGTREELYEQVRDFLQKEGLCQLKRK